MAKGKASTIELAPEERRELESLVRRHSTGQAANRRRTEPLELTPAIACGE